MDDKQARDSYKQTQLLSTQNFDKKQTAEILEESATSIQRNNNPYANAFIQGPTFNTTKPLPSARSRTPQNVTINYSPGGNRPMFPPRSPNDSVTNNNTIQYSSHDSRLQGHNQTLNSNTNNTFAGLQNSLSEEELAKLFDNESFYRNLLKYNKRFAKDLERDVRAKIFEENKEYINSLISTKINAGVKKDFIDFKVELSEFLKELLKINSQEQVTSQDSIQKIESDLSELKERVSVTPLNQNRNDQNQNTSQFHGEMIELRSQLSVMQKTISEIKENESKLEHKLNTTMQAVNPNDTIVNDGG